MGFKRKGKKKKVAKKNSDSIKRNPFSSNKIISIKRTCTNPSGGNLPVTVASAPVFGAITFSLNDLPDVTDFTLLFDQFRIVKITVDFQPVFSMIPSNIAGTNPGYLHTIIDYTDGVTPGSVDQMREFPSFKSVIGVKRHKRSFIPRASMVTNATGTPIPGATSRKSQWYSCSSATELLVFYGLKWGVDRNNFSSGPVTIYVVECEFFMEFKNPK